MSRAEPTHGWYDPRQFGWMGYLLIAVPIAVLASLLNAPKVVQFLAARGSRSSRWPA